MTEVWRAGGSTTGTSPELARAVEAEGWDGQMFLDSQCLSADPYAQMGIWAAATERIKLATGVANPLTRNLAVTASGAATIQKISQGRAVLGFGRGDSALACLGHAPVEPDRFQVAMQQLQVLLEGGEVPFDEFGPSGDAPWIDASASTGRPQAVRLDWLPEDLPKVPLDVAATWPEVIMMSAPVAERITFCVGAEADRLQWALDLAREARAGHGLDDTGVSWGAQVVVVCHSDKDVAMETAMEIVPPFARYQSIGGRGVGAGAGLAAYDLQKIRASYGMDDRAAVLELERGTHDVTSPEFVSRFAIVGSPELCRRRLFALKALGLDRFIIIGPSSYPQEWGETRHLFVREVLPALQER